MIDRGIPHPDAWPDGVLERLSDWEQGDLVADPPLFYFADPSRAIWSATALYAETSTEPEVILAVDELAPPYGIVTTQTCDIAEEGRANPLRPWVQIAPVYEITDSGWKRKLRQGGGPRYWLRIPDLPGDQVWAADLRIEVPVEKSWFAMQDRIIGFQDEEAKQAVGDRVAWLRGRRAFSREFDAFISSTLHRALDELADSNPDLHERLMKSLEEVGVLVDSHLRPTSVQLVFLTTRAMDEECREWLQEWRDHRLKDVEDAGITFHALDFRELVALSAAEYRRMTPIWTRGTVALAQARSR